jgi:hypothetical protein
LQFRTVRGTHAAYGESRTRGWKPGRLMLVFKNPVKVFLTFFGRRLQEVDQKKNPVQIILFFPFKSTNQRKETKFR